ncbi:MAG: DUF4922 domain-containing protein [Proteobacteria bacterium]|nr:DUF4922 domain-containing protein [Pseudomonadota bacterium]
MSRIYAVFDRQQGPDSLSVLCCELLSEQKDTWPDCRQGYAYLENIAVREIACNGFIIRVQHNPGRIKSTLADVEEKGIKERPCFLCLNNLPEEQKGIIYRNEYLILCNPAPVFPSHFTICHKEHRPQSITEHIDALLQLMVDLGSAWTVLYNGPKCGASAPDHLHFQAVRSGQMPIEKEIKETGRLKKITKVNGILLSRVRNVGREIIVAEGDNPVSLAAAFGIILSTLKIILSADVEPMINVAGFYSRKRLYIAIFPRAKHRPDAFFKEGDGRLMVSPAVVEMGGILVTPVEKDFEDMNASIAEDIFREVSLDGKILDKVFNSIT